MCDLLDIDRVEFFYMLAKAIFHFVLCSSIIQCYGICICSFCSNDRFVYDPTNT